jgi:hypothetical protein
VNGCSTSDGDRSRYTSATTSPNVTILAMAAILLVFLRENTPSGRL